jgi:DNA-binding MarR family transcriptional regulator
VATSSGPRTSPHELNLPGTDGGPRDARAKEDGELLYSMHELSRLISMQFDQQMAPYALTRAQWWGLMHIGENEGVTQSELADILQMGRASAGKLLDRMEEKGWVERRSDKTDHRVRRVYLSAGAAPAMNVMGAQGEELFRKLLAGLSRDQVHAMIAGMRLIRRNAEAPDD